MNEIPTQRKWRAGGSCARNVRYCGERYWEAVRLIYANALHALCSQGYLILTVKDHIREGKRAATAATTLSLCEELGFKFQAHYRRSFGNLSLWQRRRKERGEPVVEESKWYCRTDFLRQRESVVLYTRK